MTVDKIILAFVGAVFNSGIATKVQWCVVLAGRVCHTDDKAGRETCHHSALTLAACTMSESVSKLPAPMPTG